MTSSKTTHLDAVIAGAGFSGMYMLHSLRDKLGLSVRVLEKGGGVGGTWYWNRYPGARCDSDSYIYCYMFDQQLLQDWEWSERYPRQPEVLKYLEHVADRFDLRKDIQFDTTVTEASFDENANCWTIRTANGEVITAKYFISAIGAISEPFMPKIKGLETFEGTQHHTSHWPHDGVDFTHKRAAVIGTGATAVQVIPEISEQAKHVTVFQRTPNFCWPARHGKVDPEVVKARKADYDGIRERLQNSFFGFELAFIEKGVFDASAEERERVWDEMWYRGGFPFWIANYQDVFFSKEANDECVDYMARRIREKVKDPAIAEKLIPKNHPYGTKRQPLESNYYDTFNKPNVLLVDVNETPIEEVTPKGIRTSDQEYEVDIIVFATGFDGMTGPLKKVNLSGRNGQLLSQKWSDGPHTYLGLAMAGFPNMFTVTGPGSPSVLSNVPVSIEQHVDWITSCIDYMQKHDVATIEATAEAEDQWTAHVAEVVSSSLMVTANSWYMGANIPGKPLVFMPYLGGVGAYRQKCDEVAANGYEGFALAS